MPQMSGAPAAHAGSYAALESATRSLLCRAGDGGRGAPGGRRQAGHPGSAYRSTRRRRVAAAVDGEIPDVASYTEPRLALEMWAAEPPETEVARERVQDYEAADHRLPTRPRCKREMVREDLR